MRGYFRRLWKRHLGVTIWVKGDFYQQGDELHCVKSVTRAGDISGTELLAYLPNTPERIPSDPTRRLPGDERARYERAAVRLRRQWWKGGMPGQSDDYVRERLTAELRSEAEPTRSRRRESVSGTRRVESGATTRVLH